jgi:hypothetical protein
MRRVISVANGRRVIGFAIVAVGVWITFLPVSADIGPFDYHVACGSVWHAMLSHRLAPEHDCVLTALPHVWISGGVAAVGMGVAFWGAGRRLLWGMVGLVVLLTVLIALGAWGQSLEGTGA